MIPSTLPLTVDVITNWANSFDPAELEKMGWSREALLEVMQKKETFYTLDGQGALVSAILYHSIDQATDEILFLATTPRARKGGSMLKLLKEFKNQRPQIEIWLECREDNTAALDLYRKIGFKESGRRLSYYKDGTTAILFNF